MGSIVERRAAPPEPGRVRRIDNAAQALSAAHALAEAFATGSAQRDVERRLPWNELVLWSESGLGAITVPRRYGGPGLGNETLAEVFVILSQADAALGQIPQNHFALLGVLAECASEAQKHRLYGEALAGRRLGNAGPERASAASKTILQGSTRLRATPDGLRLSGQRFYSTGSLFAHRIPTRALDDEGRPVQVWVPADAAGVVLIDDWSSFGQRTTASGSVRFEDVAIDPQDVLPIWQLADRPGLFGAVSQLLQAAIDQGIAQAALADALAFVRHRARPWVDSGVARAADDPYILAEVGRLQVDLHAAHEVLLETARFFDVLAAAPITADGSARASVAVAEAKVLTTRIALEAAEQLFALAGSASTRAGHNLDRHWRNARVHTLHDPVRWKVQLIGDWQLNGTAPRRHSWN